MNDKELAELISEWIHSAPEERKRLEAAISEQYQVWSGRTRGAETGDMLSAWLIECLRPDSVGEELTQSLATAVAEYMDEGATDGVITETYYSELLMATPDRQSQRLEEDSLPDEDQIRNDVRRILREIDSCA